VAVDVLVPVPLHSRRLRERGYNQSALLAAEVGKRNGLPVVTDSLVRLRHTKAQVKTAGAEERQRNLAGRSVAGMRSWPEGGFWSLTTFALPSDSEFLCNSPESGRCRLSLGLGFG